MFMMLTIYNLIKILNLSLSNFLLIIYTLYSYELQKRFLGSWNVLKV